MTEKYVWLATNTAEGALVGDGLLYTSRYCMGHCGILKGTVWQGRTVGDGLSALPGPMPGFRHFQGQCRAFGTSRVKIAPSSVTKEF